MCVSVACADKCVLGPHRSKDLLVVCFPLIVGLEYTHPHTYTHHKVKTDETRRPCHIPKPLQACPDALGPP